jgi:hypothetical protein
MGIKTNGTHGDRTWAGRGGESFRYARYWGKAPEKKMTLREENLGKDKKGHREIQKFLCLRIESAVSKTTLSQV